MLKTGSGSAESKKRPFRWMMFICWMPFLWLPPYPSLIGKSHRGRQENGRAVLTSRPSGQGGGGLKRVLLRGNSALTSSATHKHVSLCLWPNWGNSDPIQRIGKSIGCSISASTEQNYEGRFTQRPVYRNVVWLGPYFGDSRFESGGRRW